MFRQLADKRRTCRRRLMGRAAVKGGGLFALAGLLLVVGIVDWPNLPFAAAFGAIGALLCFTVIGLPLGLFLL